MAKRYSDPRQYFLGCVPTLGDKCIHTSKLPSNREVLFSFIIHIQEEYLKNKTSKSSFKAAMTTAQEAILLKALQNSMVNVSSYESQESKTRNWKIKRNN